MSFSSWCAPKKCHLLVSGFAAFWISCKYNKCPRFSRSRLWRSRVICMNLCEGVQKTPVQPFESECFQQVFERLPALRLFQKSGRDNDQDCRQSTENVPNFLARAFGARVCLVSVMGKRADNTRSWVGEFPGISIPYVCRNLWENVARVKEHVCPWITLNILSL